jgi:hypothetical protein
VQKINNMAYKHMKVAGVSPQFQATQRDIQLCGLVVTSSVAAVTALQGVTASTLYHLFRKHTTLFMQLFS